MTRAWRGLRGTARWLMSFRVMIILGSLLFLAIIGTAFYLVNRNAKLMHELINEDFNQQQLILSRQAASQIDASLLDLEAEIAGLRRLPSNVPDNVLEEAMRAMILRTRDKGLVEVWVLREDGAIKAGGHAHGTEGISQERIAEDCRTDGHGHLFLGPLRTKTSAEGESLVTGILCTEPGEGLRVVGLLDVTKMVQRVTSNLRSGRTGYAWVIDQSGMFLYHPDHDFIGKNAFTARAERKPYISFAQINTIMKERMLRGEEGVGIYESGWHRGAEGQIEKLIAFTSVASPALPPGRLWSVAVAAPISEVSEAVRRVYMRQFGAQAALIAGLFVFGVLLALYQNQVSEALKEQVKRTEADLQNTERIYQRVVEQATDLIYILDLEMRVVLLNRHSLEIFSSLIITEPDGPLSSEADLSSPALYIGKKLDQLFPPPDVQFMQRQLDRVLAQKSSHSFHQTLTVKGRRIHLNTKLVPIRDDRGQIYQVMGIARDVTEKVEMDQRIYNTEKLASIGTLAAGVAHEINNPLAIILGFTDLVLEHFKEDSPQYNDLKVIEYNANHAKKVVEDLLGFARITEGLEDVVDVGHSINTVTHIIKNTLMTKKVDLEVSLPSSLPRVKGDPREFQQVIFNLVNNSIAAMEKKGGKLKISAAPEGDWVNIRIEDSGVGIPDRIKPQIFDPFFTTKKVGEGTGLGLSLCYGIVKKYGGKISFTSSSAEDNPDLPSGTAFTVTLPVASSEIIENGFRAESKNG